MPLINFKSGKVSAEQKKELIVRLTEVAHEVTSIPKEYIMVFVDECSDDNIGVAGKSVTEIKAAIQDQSK